MKQHRVPTIAQLATTIALALGLFTLLSYTRNPVITHLQMWKLPRSALLFIVDIPFVLVQIGVAAWLNHRLFAIDIRRALERTGLFNLSPRPLIGGLVAFVAILTVEFSYINMMGGMIEWKPSPLTRTLYGVISIGVIEELVFRGFIMRNLREHTKAWPAILVSACLFAAAHHQHLAKDWLGQPDPWPSILYLAALLLNGVVLGWVYEISRYSLAACILIHIPGNAPLLWSVTLSNSTHPPWWIANGWIVVWSLEMLFAGAIVWAILRWRRFADLS